MQLKKYLFLLLALLCTPLAAQTLQKGRELFAKGDYEAAKPIMLKYLKQKPADPSRNFWYGVCLLETGQGDASVKYLEKAAQLKITKAHRYLADYYASVDSYQLAMEHCEKYTTGMESDKALYDQELYELYTQRLESLKLTYRLIRNTQKICFVDSFIINKNELLNSYLLSDATGSFSTYKEFFQEPGEGSVFLPQLGTSVVFSRKDHDGKFNLWRRYKSFDSWVDEQPLTGLNHSGANDNYPFICSDGVTIYYASDGEGSLGGLDIFVSRFNTNTDRYLIPENVGMPFNSPDNDYFMVIDEINNLGWFATDRRQPQDTVCIYVFIPDDTHSTYNYELSDTAAVHRAARLLSIKESQAGFEEELFQARRRLSLLACQGTANVYTGTTLFVLDNLTDYHSADDFQSSDARQLFTEWEILKEEYAAKNAQLESRRTLYAESTPQARQQMSSALLQLEGETLALERRIIDMEITIRNKEIEFLRR